MIVLSSCRNETNKGVGEIEKVEKKIENTDPNLKDSVGNVLFHFYLDTNGKYEIFLADTIKAQINQYLPGFKTYTYADFVKRRIGRKNYLQQESLPFAVIADFNEDSIADIILFGYFQNTLFGYSHDTSLLLSLISKNGTLNYDINKIVDMDYMDPKSMNGLESFIYLTELATEETKSKTVKKACIFKYLDEAFATSYWHNDSLVLLIDEN